MTPTSITLDVNYNSDGTLDSSSLLLALEYALNGRIRITDWYDETFARNDYPHLDDGQRRALISSIDVGDYDTIINSDGRRAILDEAAERAGVPAWRDEGDDEEDDDASMIP